MAYGAFTDWSASPLSFLGMFIFGVALTVGGFFPEALRAQRILSFAILNSAAYRTKNEM
jgi:hypothetical protein